MRNDCTTKIPLFQPVSCCPLLPPWQANRNFMSILSNTDVSYYANQTLRPEGLCVSGHRDLDLLRASPLRCGWPFFVCAGTTTNVGQVGQNRPIVATFAPKATIAKHGAASETVARSLHSRHKPPENKIFPARFKGCTGSWPSRRVVNNRDPLRHVVAYCHALQPAARSDGRQDLSLV